MLRRLAVLPSGLACALALAGCGGGESPDSADTGGAPTAVVQAAAQRSADAGSSRFALSSTTVVSGQPLEVTGEGQFDSARKQGSLRLTLPNGDIEQRTVGGKVYVALTQQPGVYYAVDLARLQGTSLGASSDPGAPVASLAAAGDVEKVEEQDVRGVSTTHYRGVVDVKKAVALGGAAGQVAQATLGRSGAATVPFDAWIDDDGRLRRYTVAVTVPAGPTTGGQPVRSTTTIELFDYGVAVTVSPPDPGSVRDGAPLLAALQGGAPK